MASQREKWLNSLRWHRQGWQNWVGVQVIIAFAISPSNYSNYKYKILHLSDWGPSEVVVLVFKTLSNINNTLLFLIKLKMRWCSFVMFIKKTQGQDIGIIKKLDVHQKQYLMLCILKVWFIRTLHPHHSDFLV